MLGSSLIQPPRSSDGLSWSLVSFTAMHSKSPYLGGHEFHGTLREASLRGSCLSLLSKGRTREIARKRPCWFPSLSSPKPQLSVPQLVTPSCFGPHPPHLTLSDNNLLLVRFLKADKSWNYISKQRITGPPPNPLGTAASSAQSMTWVTMLPDGAHKTEVTLCVCL